MINSRMKNKSRLLLGRDLNPYFEHKKMNPNFRPFTGSVGFILAERTGFEPAIPFGIPAFQASTFDRSDISPRSDKLYYTKNGGRWQAF